MATELRGGKLQNRTNPHVGRVTLLDAQLTTNVGICNPFRNYYKELFTGDSSLSLAHVYGYLAEIPHFDATEAAGYEGPVTEYRI